MGDDHKSFQPLRLEMIGVEKGSERFSKDGHIHLPTISRWRNNLTALSQYDNLYFIASGQCIAVYQPQFPYQTLRRKPALLIYPELQAHSARGYLSGGTVGHESHCINHLKVGDLGSQEILLLATDSGNVEAYYTSAIAEAIRRAPGTSSQADSSDVTGLRPFFSQWVHQSAWGLDIHKEARMIAVSANIPNEHQPGVDEDVAAKITVFAFALSPRASSTSTASLDSDPDLESDWSVWNVIPGATQPTRDRNYKITLAGFHGHDHNIPNVQFARSTDDTGGIWLLSTDITGYMKLWQIWKKTCFRTWNFGDTEPAIRPWFHRQFPGWSVAALDVSCFRPVDSMEEFVGVGKAPPYHGYSGRGQSFNISTTIRRLQENSQLHPSNSGTHESDVHDNDTIELVEEDEESTTLHQPDFTEDTVDLSFVRPEPPDVDALMSEYSGSWNLDHLEQPMQYVIQTDDELTDEDDSDSNSLNESPAQDTQMPPIDPRFVRKMRRLVTPIQNQEVSTPDIAIIHCTDSHVRLLGSPKQNFPHIFCASILRQLVSPEVINHVHGMEFAHMDRLNMLHTIPELGVVIIATQTGRAAVCALTKRANGLLGFRVDGILPTRKQERNGLRPEFCTLLGMAISPIQGYSQPAVLSSPEAHSAPCSEIDGVPMSFDPNFVVLRHPATPQERHAWNKRTGSGSEPKLEHVPWATKSPDEIPWQATEPSRRYRIMLTYSDLTVLTYELWRDVEKCDKVAAG